MKVATDLLILAGEREGVKFDLSEHLIGGAAIEAHDDPYPKETEEACKGSDAVLLAAIGGCAHLVCTEALPHYSGPALHDCLDC